MTTRIRLAMAAVALMLAATGVAPGTAAYAHTQKGGTPVKSRHPVLHGPGSTHNPIVRHPPLHGPGSSHNPIVVPPDCNDPNTLCRRP